MLRILRRICLGSRTKSFWQAEDSAQTRYISLAPRSSQIIDLRSDVRTLPSTEMKEVMLKGTVGDDVFDEDVTVQELESKICEITGKEAALFVTSGTMGNLLGILSHCQRRDSEILVGDVAHTFLFEQGHVAQLGGVQCSFVPTQADGTFKISDLESRVRPSDIHMPTTALLCLENPQCTIGGIPLPLPWLEKAKRFAESHNIPIHVDAARIFNASVSLKLPPVELLKNADSASICLSKGLGAPIGSVLVGTKDLIFRAKRLRKALGGGWRQPGMLAAAGVYVLENHVQKLAQDHIHARLIGEAINSLCFDWVRVDMQKLQINLIFVEFLGKVTNNEFYSRLKQVTSEEKAKLGDEIILRTTPFPPNFVRLVTHLSVSSVHVDMAIGKILFVLKEFNEQLLGKLH